LLFHGFGVASSSRIAPGRNVVVVEVDVEVPVTVEVDVVDSVVVVVDVVNGIGLGGKGSIIILCIILSR